MEVIHTRADLAAWQMNRRGSLGFVPTMGNLHAGHLALVEAAKAENDLTAVSIFVNPTQFGPNEDFSRYPRTLAADTAALAAIGCDLVFAPEPEAVYPPGFQTYVHPGPTAEPLCGQFRPGHFRGVATVVTALLNLIRPDRAYFGQKDWQQCMVLRRLVLDLALPLEIVLGPTMREADGLAMSSRNQYLQPDDRQRATQIHRALTAAHLAHTAGEQLSSRLEQIIAGELAQDRHLQPQYIAVVDAETLQPVEMLTDRPAVAAVAAYLGQTRLIDNVLLGDANPLLRTRA